MSNELKKEELKIREDLNDMTTSIKFKTISNKFGTRNVCNVTLFNNETIGFKDTEGVFDLLVSYTRCGEKDFFTVKLVDEISKEKEDKEPMVYTCVLYTFKDGSTHRLFPEKKFVANKIIDNYYNLFKKTQKPSTNK